MFVKIAGVRMAAIRAAVPSREIGIEDELEFYGGSEKKAARATKMIGINRRRIAWPGQTASDLCEAAARSLLSAHSLQNELDALIFISQMPDFDFPATACILQHKLGLTQNCAAFDVNQGCAGYVYGIWLAASLIAGGCKNILILAGDVPPRPRDRANRVVAPIFGDGGSATLIQADAKSQPVYFSVGTDGSGFGHIIMPAGRGRIPMSANPEDNRAVTEDINGADGFAWQLFNTYMDGQAVFAFTMRIVPEHIDEFLRQSGTSREDLDWFVLHQANKQIIAEIARKANLPAEKTPWQTFSRYGNLSSASIPAALCDLFGPQGSSGQCSLLLSGYGVGLSWASCIWHADNCDIAPVINVDAPDESHGRKEQIEFWREKIKGCKNDR